MKNTLSMYMLNKADKMTLFKVYQGKKNVQAKFEYNPYGGGWMFDRPGSMWGMVPVKKTEIIKAIENDLSGYGTGSNYLELVVKSNGKTIGVISNYEYPEAAVKSSRR